LNYINDPGFEVPDNKILIIPFSGFDQQYDRYPEVVESLKGNIKRDWFNSHFYYCLPLNIGNQYGFIIKAAYDFDATWDGSTQNSTDISVNIYEPEDSLYLQNVNAGFGEGILTVQNTFQLKTPPGINLMTIAAPNFFTPGIQAMTAVIETDQMRRDFSFNLKLTDPGRVVSFKKGDPLAAFIPIPRYFVEEFELDTVNKYFSEELIKNEQNDANELGRQRMQEDREKAHYSGRKYFNGIHAFGQKFKDHQKRV
jgi:hypothetical protein